MYRARTARDMDISVVFHDMLFLAVMMLPVCDSRVLIPNTALDVGGSVLKYSVKCRASSYLGSVRVI